MKIMGMGGGLDFLENSLIWVGHNKMLLGVKNFKKCNLTLPPLHLSKEEKDSKSHLSV